MAERPDDGALLDRYSRAQCAPRARGRLGLAHPRARARCTGSASPTSSSTARSSTFSGGELTRASLARALAGDPDLLLLDEPTNHLDIASLEWLEDYLTGLDAAVILVAHDRWFLEAVGTSVLELEAGRARFFPGTWHAWRREAAARDIQLGKQIEKQQAEIARMERFIERFRYKATKARQAQSRVKKLDEDGADRARSRRTTARSASSSAAPSAPGAWCSTSTGRPARGAGQDAARGRRAVARARRARVARRPERRRQDDPDRGARRAAASSTAASSAPATTCRSATCRSTPRSSARRAPCWRPRSAPRAHAQQGTRAARPLPVQRRGGGEADGRAVRRRAAAAVAGDPGGVRGERPDSRRADEPPRHRRARGARGRAQRLRRQRPARIARPRTARRRRHAHVRARGRHLRSYLGGWAEYSRVREERREAEASATGRAKRATAKAKAAKSADNGRPKPAGPSKNAVRRAAELEREVEKAEAALRAIEDELADPVRLGEPHQQRARDEAPRGRQEGRRGGLRALGGSLRLAPPDAECRQVETEYRVQDLAAHSR